MNNEMIPNSSSSHLLKRIALGLLVLVVGLALGFWLRGDSAKSKPTTAATQKEEAKEHGESKGKEEGKESGEEGGEKTEVSLSPEALKSAKIQTATVATREVMALLSVTGTVEANQQLTQQATPLVSGRVEKVFAALGDRVRAGAPLALISSPQIAQLHGKLHEAETKLALAERNYSRVQLAENRAAVLSAKAKLDEAEATLKRTRRLIELGAGAGKDLIAAETAYKTAKAEYDFQSNIALNREVQEARAEVETSRVDVSHIRDELAAFGARVKEGVHDSHDRDSSIVTLQAPISGTVIERTVNAGAGIESGKPLFTIADTSSLWVIASVPEAQVRFLKVGTPAEVTGSALNERVLSARVSYIDPQLNEETRSARVRVEIANPRGELSAGMFVEVGFRAASGRADAAVSNELVIPDDALQRLGDRTIVFVPEEKEAGHFKVREVKAGGLIGGLRVIRSGLKAGESVVAKGSFTLKSQLQKSELGEDE